MPLTALKLQNEWFSIFFLGSFYSNCSLNIGVPSSSTLCCLLVSYHRLSLSMMLLIRIDSDLTCMPLTAILTPPGMSCLLSIISTFPTTSWHLQHFKLKMPQIECVSTHQSPPFLLHFLSVTGPIHPVIQNQAGFGHPKSFPFSSSLYSANHQSSLFTDQ